MAAFLLAASLAASASAAVVPRADGCTFQLTASGGASGTVGQLSDGQNRVGGSYSAATYSINNGAITDGNGRGCILTPPTTQFQCDQGATPTGGFSIGNNGAVQYNGSTKFYACAATTDNKEYNIYTVPVANQKNCVEITLSTGGKCAASDAPKPSTPASKPTPASGKPASQPAPSGVETTKIVTESKPAPTTIVETAPAPSKPAQSQPAPAPPASKPTQPKSSACPTNINGPHQTPHLIVPISKSQPDKAFGTQYNGNITPDQCTIFNFDIPQDYAGKSCSVIFLFPEQKDLQTSSFTFSGSGSIAFSELSSAASEKTTYNTCPAKKSDLGTVAVKPGNSYAIATESCAAGKTVSIEACSMDGLSLNFFQDWNPSPIGTYITSC